MPWRVLLAVVLGSTLLAQGAPAAPVAAAPGAAALRCMAVTLYFESRAAVREGMISIGWVVLNRVRSGKFPSTVCGVVHQGRAGRGCQFSYWCDGRSDRPRPGDQWDLARIIARELLSDPPPDPTGGALFFHAITIPRPPAFPHERTRRIAGHFFYR